MGSGIHFSALRTNIGKGIENVRKLVAGQLLHVMVPTIDGPIVSPRLSADAHIVSRLTTHEAKSGEACQLTKYMAVL